jgi:hypothetical protein
LFPVAKKKLAGKPQRFEEQKKGLIAPMKDLKIMADDLNVPTQGLRSTHNAAGEVAFSLTQHSNRVSTNTGLYVILLGRDKGAEMVLEIQSTACRD